MSDHFDLPIYQQHASVPRSINDNHVGRGVPDVAGNASLNSGYSGLFLSGNPMIGNGTSASAPQWAGLIAVINAALVHNLGFVNPILYSLGSHVFRDIVSPPGPADNGNAGVPGYPARPGWDACTGWGSPNGQKLLHAIRRDNHQHHIGIAYEEHFTGKVEGVVFDRFGDFEGFLLKTVHGEERKFQSRETEVEELAHRALMQRNTTIVTVHQKHPYEPIAITLRRP